MGAQKHRWADLGWKLVLVHREPLREFDELLTNSGLGQVPHLEDLQGELYTAFGLGSGGLSELVPPRVWWRGFQAILKGFRPGKPGTDIRQMAGAFLVEKGRIIRADRAKVSSDLPDIDKLIAAAGTE